MYVMEVVLVLEHLIIATVKQPRLAPQATLPTGPDVYPITQQLAPTAMMVRSTQSQMYAMEMVLVLEHLITATVKQPRLAPQATLPTGPDVYPITQQLAPVATMV